MSSLRFGVMGECGVIMRASKSLTAFGLVLFFALGVLCSTMAAPSQSLASVTDCSRSGGAMAMAGRESPSYLCGFGSSAHLLSQGALGSSRSDDLLKNAFSLIVGEAPSAAPNDGAVLLRQQRAIPFVIGPRKVSIRLFNSILNL